MNTGILKHIEKLSLTRTNSDSFSTTRETHGFVKYVFFVLSTLSSLGTKGIQYAVLRNEFMDVYYLFILLLLCQT